MPCLDHVVPSVDSAATDLDRRIPMTDIVQAYAVDRLADFEVIANQTDLSGRVVRTLKRNVLDSIACAVGALDGELLPAIRAHVLLNRVHFYAR
jgi:hypothetical protein